MQISAVVLAGGEGSRLGGVDKGLIDYKGRKMIEWTLDVVKPHVDQLLISCNRNITDYMPLADSVVCDRIAGSLGPLAGIHAALESMTSRVAGQSEDTAGGLLVLPCDTPLINYGVVKRLVSASQEAPGSIIMLTEGEFAHPLHAVIPLSLKQDLEEYLIDGGRAVRKWYKQHSVIEIELPENDQAALINVNTAEQLDRIS